jgi:putative metallohydrolase (TIGR04338 family)
VNDSPRGASRRDDPHRTALYAAEDAALPGGSRRFTRFEHLERYVHDVVLGPWWERTFPDAPVEVDVLRRSRSATFSAAHVAPDAGAAVVWIRDGSWDLVTVVHELAHVATGSPPGPQQEHGGRQAHGAHGERFATTLLICWRELLGVQAYGALRSGFDDHGVPYQRDRLL